MSWVHFSIQKRTYFYHLLSTILWECGISHNSKKNLKSIKEGLTERELKYSLEPRLKLNTCWKDMRRESTGAASILNEILLLLERTISQSNSGEWVEQELGKWTHFEDTRITSLVLLFIQNWKCCFQTLRTKLWRYGIWTEEYAWIQWREIKIDIGLCKCTRVRIISQLGMTREWQYTKLKLIDLILLK